MVSRRGLLFGNRGEKPQGDITNSETTRHGFRSREPLAHETRGMLTRRVFGVLTIATATALGLGVGTNPREVEATPIRVRGIEVETVELSDSINTLLENNGRATRMIMNGSDIRLLNSPGGISVGVNLTNPQGNGVRVFQLMMPLPSNRTPQNMIQHGLEAPNMRGTWAYGVEIDDLEQLTGRDFQGVMLVREETIDDGDRVRNFFAIPTQDESGRVPISMMVGNQPTYYAYCISYYPDSRPDQSPIWSGRVLLYNRGDADPAPMLAQR